MTVCSNIKSYTRHHERIADLFSLLAVILFFASIWFGISFQQQIIEWVGINIILNGSLAILALVINVLLIFVFLNIGSSRFTEEENDACFGTFRGRRHGGPSLGSAFKSWLHHMEHVNKKHR